MSSEGTPIPASALAWLKTLVEQLPVGVVMCDENARLTLANDQWRAIFGVTLEEIGHESASPKFRAMYPDGSTYARDDFPLRRSLRTGERVVGEPMWFRDGPGDGERLIEVSSTPIRGADGEIAAAAAVFFDATARVALEREVIARRAATETQALLDNVFDAAGDGIWVLDGQGRTVLLNPAAQLMTGWAPDDILGEVSHFVIHHSHADGSEYPIEECPIYRSVFFGEPCQVEDEVFWRKDGTSFPVSYRSTPIYDGEDQVGAVQVFRDLTRELADAAERDRQRDQQAAEQRAFEINDTVVQRLAEADLAFSLGRPEQAASAVRAALEISKRIISDWAGGGGLLTRSAPARDEPR